MSVLCKNAIIVPKNMKEWVLNNIVNENKLGVPIGEVSLVETNNTIKVFFKSNGFVSEQLLSTLSSYVSGRIVHRELVDIGYYAVKMFKRGKRVLYKERDYFYYTRHVAWLFTVLRTTISCSEVSSWGSWSNITSNLRNPRLSY